jgi:adenosylcobyric acid synthase
MSERAPLLHVLSPHAAGGKTVWVVGLVRALMRRGLRVVPFKAIGESETGASTAPPVCSAALHMAAAADLAPHADLNPVVVAPLGHDRGEVWLHGGCVGSVRRVGRDMPILADLGTATLRAVEAEVLASLARCRSRGHLVVSEGAGAATELHDLGTADMANLQVGALADVSVLVARASRGGALASLHGCRARLPESVVAKLRGVVLNDVRAMSAETAHALATWARGAELEVLSLVPWLPFFDGRPKNDAFTARSREDHDVLGAAI